MSNIVVVGAGYAGVLAANRLAKVAGLSVTVVNPRPDFVERIRLHQYATGSGPATRPLSKLLRRNVELRLGKVESIAERSVLLDDGTTIDFDYLVYAVGSHVDGRPNTYNVGALEDADRLGARLDELAAGAPVVVVGGGLTGVETAAEIAEQFPELDVHLASDSVAGWLPAATRDYVAGTLSELGVTIHEATTITQVDADGVRTASGATIASDATIWAGSFTVPDLARRSGLLVDDFGRLRTDKSLVSLSNPRIVGVGDAVAPPASVAGHLRMSCQSAMPLGVHGAATVAALVRGRSPQPVSIGMFGQCVSLGRKAGFMQFTRSDDTPSRFVVKRRIGTMTKELVCRFTVVGLRGRAVTSWRPAGPKVSAEEVTVGV
ncbi:NAD(P)/FAD-dependent oxidoreductase [Antrihabitans spumae]|jgi:NADH:ubiquinone reductase (H+-translocating)|uniref:NAD(P)/FAD-dependent oxidoreductase n=1 Tax=Antrihabitans spumae TaxID=3373370 RepID=A0ABW7JPF5_9NOCA